MTNAQSVSIIIPFFHGEKYFKELIESINIQSTPPVEIIIVNNSHSVESNSFLDSVEERYHHLHFKRINQSKNLGVAAARNAALPYCTGEFITLLDQDDLLCGQYSLQSRIDFLMDNPQFSGVAGHSVRVDEHSQLLTDKQVVNEFFLTASSNPERLLENYCRYALDNSTDCIRVLFLIAGSSLFRTSVFKQFQFDPAFETEDDVEWTIRFLQTHQLKLLPYPFHFRRVHPHQYHLNTPSEVFEIMKKRIRHVLDNLVNKHTA